MRFAHNRKCFACGGKGFVRRFAREPQVQFQPPTEELTYDQALEVVLIPCHECAGQGTLPISAHENTSHFRGIKNRGPT